jgi:tetratricopeptide (TPR) repeat protein
MTNSKLYEKIGTSAKVLCALSLAAACNPAWSETAQPRYEMAVYADSAHGQNILSGRFDQAIDKIRPKTHGTDALLAQTNLCVAFAKSGDIEAADKACDKAVVLAKSLRKVRRTDFRNETSAQIRARYVAVALSNRGVVKAVQGDLEAARKDFDAALAQEARMPSIHNNIERLSIAANDAA